jgi:DNA-directed RNA polymerase specialized sigma24 family protein
MPKFCKFDEAYLRGLQEGDPAVQQHFAEYFGEVLLIKLAARSLAVDQIDEVRQETFARVLASVRDGAIHSPASLGSFVVSVCNVVLLERSRPAVDLGPLDDALNCPLPLSVPWEDARTVQEVLAQLGGRDKEILHAVFFQERGTEDLCREFGVGRKYLYVLVRRAKARFRARYEHSRAAPG